MLNLTSQKPLTNPPKHLIILALSLQNNSLETIGKRLGLSRERVRQVLALYQVRNKYTRPHPEGISGLEAKFHFYWIRKKRIICPYHNRLKRFAKNYGFYCRGCTQAWSKRNPEIHKAYQKAYHDFHREEKQRYNQKSELKRYILRNLGQSWGERVINELLRIP